MLDALNSWFVANSAPPTRSFIVFLRDCDSDSSRRHDKSFTSRPGSCGTGDLLFS